MKIPKNKKPVNVVFLTKREYLVFSALRHLKKKSAGEMIMEWLEYDMAKDPELAEKAIAIIKDMESI